MHSCVFFPSSELGGWVGAGARGKPVVSNVAEITAHGNVLRLTWSFPTGADLTGRRLEMIV